MNVGTLIIGKNLAKHHDPLLQSIGFQDQGFEDILINLDSSIIDAFIMDGISVLDVG
ncbi:7347_t:CDS:2, partial [Funneliformis mosseae]